MVAAQPTTQPIADASVTCLSADGVQIRAGVVSLCSNSVVFEVYTPQVIVRISEVLSEFKIVVGEQTAYCGKAVVRNHVSSGIVVFCEVELEDSGIDAVAELTRLPSSAGGMSTATFFMRAASQSQIIYPEVKIAVADLLNFLLDLRRWSERVEIGIRHGPTTHDYDREFEELTMLDQAAAPALIQLFERFEIAAESISPDLRGGHGRYIKRLLHPIVLCSPFMYRSFHKPLGYAGDYEMVNMMLGERFQGGSFFAKVLNSYFLSTPPVVAHQNRITYLTGILQDEACRCRVEGAASRFFSLGCGPAIEVQEFLTRSELSNGSHFTLVDFSLETIEYVSSILDRVRAQNNRRMTIECINKSVIQLLKESARTDSVLMGGGFDVVYCAGLFDYLADPICERLTSVFYKMLVPGGLLVATNVFAENPSRQWMEYSVDWHLIHRDRRRMLAICPKDAPQSACSVKCDPIGLNLFVEVRKPKDA